MTFIYRYGKPIPGRLQTLEKPGEFLAFDVDRGLVTEVSAQCNLKAFIAGLKGKSVQQVRDAFSDFGKKVMQATIQLADTKYLDRAAEVIEKVYQQTGISFPHRFQRYVELSVIALRPMDRWNIVQSTPNDVVLQVQGCAILQAQQESGIAVNELPCKAFCRASFTAAAQKTGDNVSIQQPKELPRDKMCEFHMSVGV